MTKLPLDQDGYPDPSALTKEQLEQLVQQLQSILWGAADDETTPDPAREWESDTIERVAELLEHQGLKPEAPK